MRYKEVISALGRKIKEARKEIALDQTGLIERLQNRVDGSSFNRNKLSALENCGNPKKPENEKKYDLADISVRSLCALSEILDTDLLYLFGRQDYKKLEFEDICRYTGLSEKAVNNLYMMKFLEDSDSISALNTILESPFFITALQSLTLAARLREDEKIINGEKDRLVDNRARFSPQLTDEEIEGFAAKRQEEKLRARGLSFDLSLRDTADFYTIQAERYLVESLHAFKKKYGLI